MTTSADVSGAAAPLPPPPPHLRSSNNTVGNPFDLHARLARMVATAAAELNAGMDDAEDEDEGDDDDSPAAFLAPPRPRSAAAAAAAAAARSNRSGAAAPPPFSGDLDLLLYVRWRSASSGRTKLHTLELNGPLASLSDLPGPSRSLLARAFPRPVAAAAPAAAAASRAAAARGANDSSSNGNGAPPPLLDADAAARAAAAAANEAMRRDAAAAAAAQQQQLRRRAPSSRAAFPPRRPTAAPGRSSSVSSSSSSLSSTRPAHLTSRDFYRFSPLAEDFATPPGDVARTEFRLAATPRRGALAGWEVTLLTKELGSEMGSSDPKECPLLVTVIEDEREGTVGGGMIGIRYAQLSYPVVSVGKEFLDAAARRLLALKEEGEEDEEEEKAL